MVIPQITTAFSAVYTHRTNVEDNETFIEVFGSDDVEKSVPFKKDEELEESAAIEPLALQTKEMSLNISDMKKAVSEDLDSFSNMLESILQESGIERDPAFSILSRGDGELCIDSDRSDKEEIESALNSSMELRQTYARISGSLSLLAAGERGVRFNQAYDMDPESAIRQYRYLFNEEPCDIFSIMVSEDGCEPELMSYGMKENVEALLDWSRTPESIGEYVF